MDSSRVSPWHILLWCLRIAENLHGIFSDSIKNSFNWFDLELEIQYMLSMSHVHQMVFIVHADDEFSNSKLLWLVYVFQLKKYVSRLFTYAEASIQESQWHRGICTTSFQLSFDSITRDGGGFHQNIENSKIWILYYAHLLYKLCFC